MAGVDSAAARRRQRRLRQFLRHERQSVAMALADVMEDMGNVWLFVQILDLPVPQMVDNVTDARILDLPVADLVIDVPTISSSSCPSRAVPLEPQVVEQLVEVPTVLSVAVLLPVAVLQQQTVEQAADVPVPHGRDRRRLQGSLPRQSSTAAGAVQSVDITLHGFLPRQRSTQRSVEQLVDSSSGGQRVLQLHPLVLRIRLFQGVFALFPVSKKARRYVLAPGRNWPRTRAHPRQALMAW